MVKRPSEIRHAILWLGSINRVAKSPLITIDLEELYPQGRKLDLSQWLEGGFV